MFFKHKIPEIDKIMPMKKVVGHTFRIHDFDRNGTIIEEDGQIKAKGRFSAYGYLVVSSPLFEGKARLRIIHKDDFFLASTIFDDRKLFPLIQERDFLVTYLPKEHKDGYSITPHHVLHYALTPASTLNKYYLLDNKIHSIEPHPEKTGTIVKHEGIIKVEMIDTLNLSKENESLDDQVEDNAEVEINPNRTGRFHEYAKTMGREEALDVFKMWLLHVRYYHPKLDALFAEVSIPTFFLPVPMELLQETPDIIVEFTDENGKIWTTESMSDNLEKYANRYYPRTGNDEKIIKRLGEAINEEGSLNAMLQKIETAKEDWYYEYKEI